MAQKPQISFAGGELDPALHGRTDQIKYQTGVKTLKRFTIRRSGGVSNTAGTTFVGEVNDSTRTNVMIPFVFSESDEDQNYILEFGNQYIRFHQDGDQVVETAKTITAITKEPETAVTSAAHGYSNGDEVYLSAILGMVELNNRNFKVSDVTTNTFKLRYMYGPYVDSTNFTTYTSAGTAERIYTISSPYVTGDLSMLNRYAQSLDVVTVPHSDYAARELTRTSHVSWALAAITFAPDTSAPTNLAVAGGQGTTNEWTVTAVDADTLEESLPPTAVGSDTEATESAPRTLTWTAVANAVEYNVYKYRNGIAGWIGIAGETTFIDDGFEPDTTDNPPTARTLFTTTADYPSSSAFYQERLVLGRDSSVYTSRTKQYKNFTFNALQFVDDAVTFQLSGNQTNLVKHIVNAGGLIIFTNSSEIVVQGDGSGALTPNDVNQKPISFNGANDLRPIVIDSDVIYMTNRGSQVLMLKADGSPNLATFAAHLVRGHEIVDWAYQKHPDSIVWMVRDDGLLIGMNIIQEHAILGWHTHPTLGEVERVCVIPEENRDALYLTVKREINGRTVRYIERMADRDFGDDIRDAIFLDCALSYDGRNTDELDKMTITGGTGDWDTDQDLTLTNDGGGFLSTDATNEIEIHMWDPDEEDFVKLFITGYTSANVVTVRGDRDIPDSLQGVGSSIWSRAADDITGLWHLEGEEVGIIADGYVIASPNNPKYTTTYTVTNGTVSLPQAYGVVHVGLPYVSDVETLDIDSTENKKLVSQVAVKLNESRGVFLGEAFPADDGTVGLEEIKSRTTNDSLDLPPPLITETRTVPIRASWNKGGRVVARQVDPLPVTILSITPTGFIGG